MPPLSWIDLRPLPWFTCAAIQPICVSCHISLQGRTCREEKWISFGLFCVLFLSDQSHSMALFRVSNTCRTWRIPSCWMPRVKWIQCISRGLDERKHRCRFLSFVIQVLLKTTWCIWVRAFLSAFSHYILALFVTKAWRNLRAILETQGLESLKWALSSEICIWPYSQCP